MTDFYVRKIAQLRDEASNAWFDIYEAPGIGGNPVIVEVPREERGLRTVMRQLLKEGATDAVASDISGSLSTAIASEAPIVHRVAQLGWHNENRIFATHGHIAGDQGNVKILAPREGRQKLTMHLQHVGTIEAWQDIISVAQYSTAMLLCLCATFAAPLLALLHRPNFALVLVGPSRSGKSTAQLVGASALGFGTEGHLPNLNATPAGLLAAGMAFNDHVLPINEVGTARGAKSDAYQTLKEATYALLSGQDIIRHTSWSAEGGGGTNNFQVIITLSSEHSPDVWAARGGEIRDAGETARLISVPLSSSDNKTVFDFPPKLEEGVSFDTWAMAQFNRLRRDLPLHRGFAFREFIEIVMSDKENNVVRADEMMAYFEKKLESYGSTPISRDIIGKFSVLFAGGVLAAEAEILPFSLETLRDAIMRACVAAIEALSVPDLDRRTDLMELGRRLQGGSVIDVTKSGTRTRSLTAKADGFSEAKGPGREFVIRATSFETWFSSPFRVRQVLNWLNEEGFLETTGRPPHGRGNEWAQRQPSWPDGTRPRAFVIYLPNGVADLSR